MVAPLAQLVPGAVLDAAAGGNTVLFDVGLSRTSAYRKTRRKFGDVDHDYPWDTLDPDVLDSMELVERARVGWTENALNEYVTAAALAQLVQAMVKAQVPIDFIAMAGSFIEEEVLHVELCSRVAAQLGGGAPLAYTPDAIEQVSDPSLPLRHQVDEQVIALLCVGETLSLPMLSGCRRASAHPLVTQVLTTIVKDEADHGGLGWSYLEWVQDELDDDDKKRLAAVATRTLDEHAPVWTRLRSRLKDGVSSEGHRLADINAMGWMDSETYAQVAQNAVEQLVIERLARFGIEV